MPTYYHRTDRIKAWSLFKNGFRDGIGRYLTDSEHTGVWLSDVPRDAGKSISDGRDDVMLWVTLPQSPDNLAEYEWTTTLKVPQTGEMINPTWYRG
jgi:hypothetical protein